MKYLLPILLLLSAVIPHTAKVQAQEYPSDFSQAYLRFSSLQTNTTPNSILVVAEPSLAATENQVHLTAGNAWTISSTASDYPVSTTNLPNGITAWPGINTAQTVNGNEIVFPSGDLNPGTSYGFYLTNPPANPGTGQGDDYLWTIQTTNTGTEIETTQVAIEISEASSQIEIGAEVPPSGSYIDLSLTDDVAGQIVNQDEIITLTASYSNTFSEAQDLVLRLSWTDGTIVGESTPTIHALEYENLSATDAYNNTSPIIDTVNQTITWSIANFPANTLNETVSVSFRVKGDYKGDRNVTFSTTLQATEPENVSSSSQNFTYVYLASDSDADQDDDGKRSCNAVCYQDEQCGTNYCAPSRNRCRHRDFPNQSDCAAPSSQVSASPSPTTSPTPRRLASIFASIRPTQIGPTSAEIGVQLTTSSSVRIIYGVTPSQMNQSATSTSKTNHQLELAPLEPGTRYYFQVTANGQTSDIFTFVTASEPASFTWDRAGSLIRSNGLPLWSGSTPSPPITVAAGLPLEISLGFFNHDNIRNVSLGFESETLTNQEVLGSQSFRLQEILPGVFNGFIYPPEEGTYLITATVEDFLGNSNSFMIETARVSPPISLYDKDELMPLSDVSISLEKFNTRLDRFEPLELRNPEDQDQALRTTHTGLFLQSLPPGEYRYSISIPGYLTSQNTFSLNSETQNSFYPTIFLEKNTSLLAQFQAFTHQLSVIGQTCVAFGSQLFGSTRTFKLFVTAMSLFSSLMALLAFSARMHLDLIHLPIFLVHQVRHLLSHKKSHHQFSGRVTDSSGSGIFRASMNFYAPNKTLLKTVKTGAKGQFSVDSLPEGTEVLIEKQGYRNKRTEVIFGHNKTLRLASSQNMIQSLFYELQLGLDRFFDLLFEAFLILSFVSTGLIIISFGWDKNWWVVLLSVFNLLAYLSYRHQNISES